MPRHFRFSTTDHELAVERDEAASAAEANLNGIYVLRTSLSPEQLDAAGTVHVHKSPAHVERAFRSHKSIDLDRAAGPRPVFYCLLACYLEWHMRHELAPLV